MSQVVGLLNKLRDEIANEQKFEGFVDGLLLFIDQREEEDIVGLNGKLNHVGRGKELDTALKKKEHFVKLLETFTHFESAQEIFAFFLARIHEVFESEIMFHDSPMPRQDVQKIVEEKIVKPTLADMGDGFEYMTITPSHIRGMIFWLAERCWVRWH